MADLSHATSENSRWRSGPQQLSLIDTDTCNSDSKPLQGAERPSKLAVKSIISFNSFHSVTAHILLANVLDYPESSIPDWSLRRERVPQSWTSITARDAYGIGGLLPTSCDTSWSEKDCRRIATGTVARLMQVGQGRLRRDLNTEPDLASFLSSLFLSAPPCIAPLPCCIPTALLGIYTGKDHIPAAVFLGYFWFFYFWKLLKGNKLS